MKSGHAQLNSALWRDLEHRLGTSDLVEWLEIEAERVGALGRTPTGPISFSTALLRDRSIRLLGAKPHLPALQTILPTQGGYEIRYSPFQRVEDQRFGIAHEIAHTFWLAPGGGGQPLSPLQRTIGDDPTIEWLCNRAAAAILLPRTDLATIMTEVPKPLHRIPLLAKRYVVPERLVARRMFHDLGDEDVCLLAVRLQQRDGVRQNGEIMWFVPAPGSVGLKKRVEKRIISLELLPQIPAETSMAIGVDGRWWTLTASASSLDRAKPLSHCQPIQPRTALVGRTGGVWYLALPSQR